MIPWETAVGAELLEAERIWLKDIASSFRGKQRPVFVNIGVYRCASMYCLRAGAPRARVVGVDIKKPVGKVHSKLKAEFIIADSRTYSFDGPIHLLFIDGDHHYPAIEADIANWAPKIVPGGVVAFHDYAPTAKNLKRRPHLAGVKRAVDEWAKRVDWVRLPPAGSIIGFRRSK